MRAVNDATLANGHRASLLEQTIAGALLPWLEVCLTDAPCRDALPCSEACPTLARASPACGALESLQVTQLLQMNTPAPP